MSAIDFFSDRVVKGRGEYVCHHCRHAIPRGTTHVSVSSRSSGVYHTHRAHQDCHAAAMGRPISVTIAAAPSVESFA